MVIRFVPLAITRSGGGEACVGAVGEDGVWIRPEPIPIDEALGDDSPYRYFRWTAADLGPSRVADPRPEDRDLRRDALRPHVVPDMPPLDRAEYLGRLADDSVETALSGDRSLGLVRARVQRLYAKASIGDRVFLRAEFSDEAGVTFDWIIPEIAFCREAGRFLRGTTLDPTFQSLVLTLFERVPTFFTIGLTKPNHRFPGRFRGCHPLVVGIHTVPDYRESLAP